MKTIQLFPILAGFLLASCGGQSPSNNGAGTAEQANKEQAAESAPASRMVKLAPFGKSTEFADAKLESMAYKKGKFTFKYSGTGYQLGVQTPDASTKMCANSDKGQHIHLIIDDQPYAAEYAPEFEYPISDGEHIILAFLSRSYHESIKNGQAYIAQKVTIKNGSIVKSEDIKEPMLFYSRPKGDYVGKSQTDKVMLDFFLINATLGENAYQLAVDVNHEHTFYLTNWEPYYLENLPMGKNMVKLMLIDSQGDPVKSPYNPIERTFELKADPAEGQ